uniref:Uncharacterized protein n=1 Tax=Cajanus cajan TaxID=3821 RepID=A0A151TNA6_CAJCA|nr:hypothetical protein KK1_022158 [Cajanus cajan]
MYTRNTGGAVNKDEDHATKGPSNAQNANPITLGALFARISLAFVANNGENSDIKEEKGCYELSNEGSPEGPLCELLRVDQGCRRRVLIVFGGVFSLLLNLNIFSHIFSHRLNTIASCVLLEWIEGVSGERWYLSNERKRETMRMNRIIKLSAFVFVYGQ